MYPLVDLVYFTMHVICRGQPCGHPVGSHLAAVTMESGGQKGLPNSPAEANLTWHSYSRTSHLNSSACLLRQKQALTFNIMVPASVQHTE